MVSQGEARPPPQRRLYEQNVYGWMICGCTEGTTLRLRDMGQFEGGFTSKGEFPD